jgi:hypothetical protein
MPEKRIRPRALTLTLPDRNQPSLLFAGHKYTLRNFSEEGIGLWMPQPPPFALHKGMTIKGDIEIGQHIHPVTLEVVHVSEKIAGLRILHRSTELAEIFNRLLQPSIYADELEPHPESGREDARVGLARIWYRGRGPSELLVWHQGEKALIQCLQVCWLGRWIQRELHKPAHTGSLRDGLPLNGQRFTVNDVLLAHPEPDSGMLHEATQFLTAVPKPLPGHLLWQFLETGEQIFLSGLLTDPTRRAA